MANLATTGFFVVKRINPLRDFGKAHVTYEILAGHPDHVGFDFYREDFEGIRSLKFERIGQAIERLQDFYGFDSDGTKNTFFYVREGNLCRVLFTNSRSSSKELQTFAFIEKV